MKLFTGVVENRQDPLKLGRCQVRVVGLHNHDKTQLKTEDLPWAYPMQPITSAGISGIGHTPLGPVEGTWVLLMFMDPDEQLPIMMGTLGGISQIPNAKDDGGTLQVNEVYPDGYIGQSKGDPAASGAAGADNIKDGKVFLVGLNINGSVYEKCDLPNDILKWCDGCGIVVDEEDQLDELDI